MMDGLVGPERYIINGYEANYDRNYIIVVWKDQFYQFRAAPLWISSPFKAFCQAFQASDCVFEEERKESSNLLG